MEPPNSVPADEPGTALGKRELQRMEKEARRRALGKPEPTELARVTALELWVHRELNRLTQEQLGELLDMKQSQIARLESGFVEPSGETLVKLSERLGLDFSIEVRSGSLRVEAKRPPHRAGATPRRGSRQA